MICLRCQELENEGKKQARNERGQFHLQKLACCFNCELRNSPLTKKGYDADQKTFRLHIQQKTIFLSSNLSVYCSKLLKVMLDLHTMSRCCCQSFAVYFFIPTRGQAYISFIYIYLVYIYTHSLTCFWVNIIHFVCCEVVCNIKLKYLKK